MKRISYLTLAVFALVVVACGGTGPGPDNPTAKAAMSPEELDAALARLLVRADLADESEDHVVEKCLGCGLAMDGSAEHVVRAHGYEFHLCSDGCEERVAEDIDEALLALGELDEG